MILISTHNRLYLNVFTFATLLVTLGLLAGCNKDDFDPDRLQNQTWEPELALPLAYTEVGIADLVHASDSSTEIVTGPDQFCTLIYHDRILELPGKQFIQLSDQSSGKTIQLTSPQLQTYATTGQVAFAGQHAVVFGLPQGAEVDSIDFSSGIFRPNITSHFPADVEIRITIPSLTNPAGMFSATVVVPYTGSLPGTGTQLKSIAGYHMDLSAGGTSHNTFQVNYSIKIEGTGTPLNPADYLDMEFNFENMDYDLVVGYAGQQAFQPVPDTMAISLFKNATGAGSFTIANPSLNFEVSNSIGIPMSVRIPGLGAINAAQTSMIVCTGVPDPLPVQSPAWIQAGQVLSTGFELNNQNSNVPQVISTQPAYLVASSQMALNPAGNTLNFIPGNSILSVDMILSMPLYGTVSDFVIRDTLPFSYSDISKVESMTLRLGAENWFPMSARAKIIFLDETDSAVDTLFKSFPGIIPAGTIPAGAERVSAAGQKIMDEPVSASSLQRIQNAKKIVVEARATSISNGAVNIKIFNDYRMKFSVGVKAKLKVQ